NTWRISSTASSPGIGSGQRLTHSIASSFDLHCQSQKPAISSLVSANGPSVTVRLPPENLTRAPFELGCSPSPASITPALTSSSLNFPIAASNSLLGSAPASLSGVAFTITMNRIVVSIGRLKASEAFGQPSAARTHALLYVERGAAKSTDFTNYFPAGGGVTCVSSASGSSARPFRGRGNSPGREKFRRSPSRG